MAHSVEARAPFLDADWVEWTARLPERYKVRGLHTKWLLKAAFATGCPPRSRRAASRALRAGGMWLRHELREWTRALLGNAALDEWFRPRRCSVC
jgi:asparagine synthase (glutamine-hydrolysing)